MDDIPSSHPNNLKPASLDGEPPKTHWTVNNSTVALDRASDELRLHIAVVT